MIAREPDLNRSLLRLGRRMGQAVDKRTLNLGFGYIYYALARIYKPALVVCIGSYRGFSPICLTLAMTDNSWGECLFIDPGLVDSYWHKPERVRELNARYRLQGRLHHIAKTSQEVISAGLITSPIDLLLVDGDHSFEAVHYDFHAFGTLVRKDGLILLHDSIREGKGFTPWEVKKFLDDTMQGQAAFERLTLPFAAGLTILRKLM